MADIHGLQFTPPSGFTVDEVMVSLRGAPVDNLKDPRMLQKQHPVRPSLIIHRRHVGTEVGIEMLCGEICAELVSSIDGMQNLNTEPFNFDDNTKGLMVTFDFPVRHASVKQFQALRLDGPILTTLTLTLDSVTLSDKTKETFFTSISSTKAPQGSNPSVPTV